MRLERCAVWAVVAAVLSLAVVGAAAEAPDADRSAQAAEEREVAELLDGRLDIYLVGEPTKPFLVGVRYAGRKRIADKDFLIVSDGENRVVIRIAEIAAVRVRKGN